MPRKFERKGGEIVYKGRWSSLTKKPNTFPRYKQRPISPFVMTQHPSLGLMSAPALGEFLVSEYQQIMEYVRGWPCWIEWR